VVVGVVVGVVEVVELEVLVGVYRGHSVLVGLHLVIVMVAVKYAVLVTVWAKADMTLASSTNMYEASILTVA